MDLEDDTVTLSVLNSLKSMDIQLYTGSKVASTFSLETTQKRKKESNYE